MAYDEALAERVRAMLARRRYIEEKRMFGGLAFLRRGHVFCGVVTDDLMVRVGPDAYPTALRLAHARPMDFTGKPLAGMVFVAKPGLRTSRSLARWVMSGLQYVDTLPPKKRDT